MALPVVVDLSSGQVWSSGFVDQAGSLGCPVLGSAPAGIVLVQVVREGVPPPAYSDHDVITQDLETIRDSLAGKQVKTVRDRKPNLLRFW